MDVAAESISGQSIARYYDLLKVSRPNVNTLSNLRLDSR